MRPGRKSGRQRGSKSFPALLRGYDVGQRPSAGLTRRSAEAKARDRSVSGMPHNAELAKHQPAARRGHDDLRRAALSTIKNGRLLWTSLSIKFRRGIFSKESIGGTNRVRAIERGRAALRLQQGCACFEREAFFLLLLRLLLRAAALRSLPCSRVRER